MDNIELSTNAELQQKLQEAEEMYEASKVALQESYEAMLKASQEYADIKAILIKRGIK